MNQSDDMGIKNQTGKLAGWNTCDTPSVQTTTGEIFLDKDGCLYYKASSLSFPTQVVSDVEKWFYIDDSTILYSYEFSDPHHFSVSDIKGNHHGCGIVSDTDDLIYKYDAAVIKKTKSGETSVVMKFPTDDVPVMFENDSFYLPQGYPYSDLIYHKYYDFNGNYLSAKTEKTFMYLFLRDIECSFMHWKKLDKATRNVEISNRERKIFNRLSELRENTTRLSYDVVDEMIQLCEEAALHDPLSISGYRKAEKLLRKLSLENGLEIPMLNIMTLNRCGDFGRKNTRFCTSSLANRIWRIYKIFGAADFAEMLYDIAKLHAAALTTLNE